VEGGYRRWEDLGEGTLGHGRVQSQAGSGQSRVIEWLEMLEMVMKRKHGDTDLGIGPGKDEPEEREYYEEGD
jgi:hypothetical protein